VSSVKFSKDKETLLLTGRNNIRGNRSALFDWPVITIAGILLAIPTLLYGFPAYNHDGWVHALWYSHFSEQLWAGEPYPRWLLGLNQGLGSPALFFYQPAPYYFTSLFKPFFGDDVHGLRQLGASATLAVVASGWFAYLWLCRLVPRTPALIASVIYLVMPYHLPVDLYLRGAFAEVWAFVWLPLISLFAHKLRTGERFSIAGLAFSFALLIVSHLPTALIFSPVPILYVMVTTDRSRTVKVTAQAVAAIALSAGLAAVYLLPALTMREFVSMQEMSKPEIYFENWFVLTSILGRGFPTYLSWLVISMACVAGCAFLIARSSKAAHRERVFWTVVAVGSIVMMTSLSKPVWKLLPVLQNVQFPFRFNTILCAATAALIAFAIAAIKPPGSFRPSFPLVIGSLMVAAWLLIIPLSAWREYKVHPVTRASYRDLITNNQDAPEYRPRWAERDAFLGLQAEIRATKQIDRVNVVEGFADVTVERWAPRQINLRVGSAAGATLRVKQFYFPGWRARVNNGEPELRPAPKTGLLDIVVPPVESQTVNIELTPVWAERWGYYTSAASLMAVLVLVAAAQRRVPRA